MRNVVLMGSTVSRTSGLAKRPCSDASRLVDWPTCKTRTLTERGRCSSRRFDYVFSVPGVFGECYEKERMKDCSQKEALIKRTASRGKQAPGLFYCARKCMDILPWTCDSGVDRLQD